MGWTTGEFAATESYKTKLVSQYFKNKKNSVVINL